MNQHVNNGYLWEVDLLEKAEKGTLIFCIAVTGVSIPKYTYVHVLSCVWLFTAPRTVACQDPQPTEFSRQEYYSGLPCPPPGDQTHVSCVSSIAGRFFTHWATWEALQVYYILVLNQIHQLNHQAPQRSLPQQKMSVYGLNLSFTMLFVYWL